MQRSGWAFWSLAPPPPLLFVFLLSQLSRRLREEMLPTQATQHYLLEFGMHATSILHVLVNKQRTLIIILTNRQKFSMVCTLIDHDVNMVKTQVEWQVVSLQIFEHFDVDKKYRPWKIVAKLFFATTLTGSTPISLKFLGKNVCDKEKNKLCHHRIISKDCTLIKHSCQPISTLEIAQLW